MASVRRPLTFNEIVYAPAPTGGWNPDANPWELPANQAPVLDNALVRPGRVVVRGGVINWADLSAITTPVPPLNVCGVQPVPGGTRVAVGRKSLTGTTIGVDPWFAPVFRPGASSNIAVPTANLAVVSGGTTFTNVATAANLIPGPRGINFEGSRYYIGYGTLTAPVLDASGTFFGQSTNICTINTAGTPSALTNAPTGAIDIKGYQSRIWCLAGISSLGATAALGTGTFNPITLYFSNPLTPGGGNAASFADWKDPTLGTLNYITMDGDTTDPGIGLATVRNGLLILRQSSVWLLRGSTPATYSLVPVSRQVGCIDFRSIVETDQGVYFMSPQGLMLTDGVTVANVSGPVLHTLQSAALIVMASIQSATGGYATATAASGGQILVSMGVPDVTSGTMNGHIRPVWAGMYDRSTNSWTRVTSALFAGDGTILTAGNNYPGWVFSTPDQRVLSIGDKYITQWEAATAATTLVTSSTTNNPTAAANNSAVGGTQAWANPTNVEVPGDSNVASNFQSTSGQTSSFAAGTIANDASIGTIPFSNLGSNIWGAGPVANGQTTEYLAVTNLGLSVPANAIIVSINVTIGVRSNATGNLAVNSVKLVKGGTVQGTDEKLSNSQSVVVNGSNKTWGTSSVGTWGVSLTPADVNASNFGFAVSGTGPGPVGGDTFKLDFNALGVFVAYVVPTQYLQASSYGFGIPAGATVTGIQTSFSRQSINGTVAFDLEVKLLKAGTIQATNRAAGITLPITAITAPEEWSFGGGLRTDSYGGSSDMWGNTWTPSDINNSGFGVALSAGLYGGGGAGEADVDSMQITVYYTLSGVVKQQSFVKTVSLYDTDAAGNFQPIPFRWLTQLYPVVGTASGRRKVMQLKRFFADYVFQGIGLPSANGFSAAPVTASDAPLTGSTTIQLPPTNNSMVNSSISGGQPNPATAISRTSTELNGEISDMAFDINWTDTQQSTQPSSVAAEIYGIGIEVVPSRDLK